MSSSSRTVTEALFEYLAERTLRDDAFLEKLKRDAEAAGIPTICISPEQASLMQILLELVSARSVVEVGTLAGYSAIRMARALGKGGKVVTIEVDEDYASFARRRFLESDVADRIELRVGRGSDLLPEIPDASADAVFVDADKVGYRDYLEHAFRILRPGGLLMADNAFAFGRLLSDGPEEASVLAIRDFNEAMARDLRFRSIIVPIGDGLWVGVRQSQSNTYVI